MKPKIAVFTRPLDRGVSGSGMHLERILRAALALPEAAEFDFHFVHYKRKSYDFYAMGKEVIIPRNPLAAAGMLRPYKFSVAHYNPLTMFSPWFLGGAKRCATIHGDGEHFDPGHVVWVRKLHARTLIPMLARRLDLVYVVSKYTARYVTGTQRVDQSRIRLTYNACDSRFRVMAAEELEGIREKYAGGRPFMLVVSNFSERKNPWVSLKAFARVAETCQLDLVVVGNGWQQSPEVTEFIRSRNLTERVHLAGFVPTEDVPRLMNLAEVFVFPSLAEGFGMPNLEAMACGCPVITSDAMAIPEVVADAAIILKDKRDPVELAHAIEGILTDGTRRASLREKGLKRVRDFSWEESGRELLAGYRSLLGR